MQQGFILLGQKNVIKKNYDFILGAQNVLLQHDHKKTKQNKTVSPSPGSLFSVRVSKPGKTLKLVKILCRKDSDTKDSFQNC